jgi:hypothetical protein
MEVYKLVLRKSNEVVFKYTAYDYEEACQYFSEIKKLQVDDLLKIYNVVN